MTGELNVLKTDPQEQLHDICEALGISIGASHGDILNRIGAIRAEMGNAYQAIKLLRQANDRLTQQGQQATILFGQLKAKIDELTPKHKVQGFCEAVTTEIKH